MAGKPKSYQATIQVRRLPDVTCQTLPVANYSVDGHRLEVAHSTSTPCLMIHTRRGVHVVDMTTLMRAILQED